MNGGSQVLGYLEQLFRSMRAYVHVCEREFVCVCVCYLLACLLAFSRDDEA